MGIRLKRERAEFSPVCVEGRNCWRIVHADHAAFLIDGASYFEVFARAVEAAENSIYIVGWDIDSRIRLLRNGRNGSLPVELGALLNEVVARRRRLHAYVLAWDFSMLYALDRRPLPAYDPNWRTPRRVHFRLDGHHPVEASHHQKIVVVDDALAFVGGLDLSKGRWDTPEHLAVNPLRVDPTGDPYRPNHDVQLAVDGEAAKALGELVRERWRRATGHTLAATPAQGKKKWPGVAEPDLENVWVAISRTEAAYSGRSEAREVETLFIDMIRSARESIYMENQYFTSASIGDALASRLQERKGPEIILVLAQETSGWLEEATMGVLRARLLKRLKAADRFQRLHVYFSSIPDLQESTLCLHSKVSVIDDRLVRIGSSNLNNRSMGLDSECDLTIEDRGEVRTRDAILRFRNRIIGEHLGTGPDKIQEVMASGKSLARAIETLRNGGRCLQPLDATVPEWLDEIIPDSAVVDPERPMSADQLMDEFIPPEIRESGGHALWKPWLTLAVLLAIAAAWRWTPFNEWITADTVARWASELKGDPTGPWVLMAAYLVGGLAMFPVTLLIMATAFTFGPLWGFVYAMAGSLFSAALSYGVGRLLGAKPVHRIAGSCLTRISRMAQRHGLIAVITFRIVPIAPFSLINFAAGASRIRLTDYLAGTVLGMAPGILAITVFEHQLETAVRNPALGSFVLLLLLMVFIGVAMIWVGRKLSARTARNDEKK